MPHCTPVILTALLAVIAVTTAVRAEGSAGLGLTIPPSIKRLGVMPPTCLYYHLTAGGVHEYSDSLSRLASQTLGRSAAKSLHARRLSARTVAREEIDTASWDDIQKLCDEVVDAIDTYVAGSNPKFDGRISDFDYSIGPITRLCASLNVDGLVVIQGFDERKTPRRERFNQDKPGGVMLREDVVAIQVLIVAASGRVVWYDYQYKSKDDDMIDSRDMNRFMTLLFDNLLP